MLVGHPVWIVWLLLCWTMSTFALPAMRTYRGDSLYRSIHAVRKPMPDLPDPRLEPNFYISHYRQLGLLDAEHPSTFFGDPIGALFRWLNQQGFFGFFRMPQSNQGSSSMFVEPTVAPDNATQAFRWNSPHQRRQNVNGFNYGTDKVRGVNIGNWLVMELWMDRRLSEKLNSKAINAPKANPIVDEWTAGQYSDRGYAAQVLQSHYDTWFTEADMAAIRAAGLNHVRIPFPYWAFAEELGAGAPYLTLNRFGKLLQACEWARTHGIKVWIDIHAVPGSQNGFDNSGHQGAIHWPDRAEYYTRTRATFSKLVSTFDKTEWHGTVTAIEAVNEPQVAGYGNVRNLVDRYYPWALQNIGQTSDHLKLVVHDGFLGADAWSNRLSGALKSRVLLDIHPYFTYTDQQKRAKDSTRLRQMCALRSTMVRSQSHHPTVAGEWSINGPNGDRASDRDLPSPGKDAFSVAGVTYPYSRAYMKFMSHAFQVQRHVYEQGSGWIFWSWENYNRRDWSYKAGLRYGWIPSKAGSRSTLGENPCARYS